MKKQSIWTLQSSLLLHTLKIVYYYTYRPYTSHVICALKSYFITTPFYNNRIHPLSKQCQYKQDFLLFLPWEDWYAYCQKEFELFHIYVWKLSTVSSKTIKLGKHVLGIKCVSCPSEELLFGSNLLQKSISGPYQGWMKKCI